MHDFCHFFLNGLKSPMLSPDFETGLIYPVDSPGTNYNDNCSLLTYEYSCLPADDHSAIF